MHLLNTATLKNISGSPIALSQEPVTAFGIGPQSGRYYISYLDCQVNVLDPATLQDVAGSPVKVYSTLIILPSDEQVFYTRTPELAMINAQTFAIEKTVDFDLYGLEAGLFYPHFITPDNSLIFIAGTDPNTNDQIIKVFNAATLEVVDWSPWAGQTKQILDMLIAPDGTRMYALTGDGDLCGLDPYI